MDANELQKRLKEYGADMDGIRDRFVGDAELYASCFRSFLEEPSFAQLQRAMEEGAFQKAFTAAHAIKGLAGNLGLTPLYREMYELVESLRGKEYQNVHQEYAAVLTALEGVKALAVDAPPRTEAAPKEKASGPAKPAAARKRRLPSLDALLESKRFSLAAGGFTLVVIAVVITLFLNLLTRYQINTDKESAGHLEEINKQIALYIEDRIANDWKVAYSVASAVDQSVTGDASTYVLMQQQQRIWDVTDIILYTENGLGVRMNGQAVDNDEASQVALRARKEGQFISIIDSAISYTVSMQTEQRLQGSRLVAVAVVKDVGAFLDDMDFSAFDGAAYMYLTQIDGTVISRLNHPDSRPTYNFMALMERRTLTPLTGGGAYSPQRMLASPRTETYLATDGADDLYVVSNPIHTGFEGMRLFYLVPEGVVNRTMNGFYQYVVVLCIVVVVVFTLVVLLTFALVYRSRKRRFDKALLDREHMLDLLVRNTDNAFALLSTRQEAPIYFTSNMENATGYPYLSLEKLEKGYRLIPSAGETAGLPEAINQKLAEWDGQSEFVSDSIQTMRNGHACYYELHIYPSADSGDEFVSSIQDVTQAYEREAVVREALSMAERANDAKDRFLANMSHDIRTPMNAIINMTDFAIDSVGDPETQHTYLEQVRKSSDHLLGLINDVLDMSRIESGQTTVGSEPFNILKTIDQACDMVRPLAEEKRQRLIVNCAGVGNPNVMGDQLKISRVFINLLSNAVKFTPAAGTVRLAATELPSLVPDMASMRFVVEDNGIGIAPEMLEKIFEPFVRVNDKAVAGVEGTGLGLPICRSYVNAMGGTLTAASREGRGSVFTVEIFFKRAAPENAPAANAARAGERPFEGKRCLLCEDNEVNRIIGRTMLENLGFVVEEAKDGRMGAEMFIASPADAFDVIYMDIQMPEMDGYQTARAIRNSGHPQAGSVPIIAMTANVFAEDIEKARQAGMNGYVGKPIMNQVLADETARVLGEAERPGGTDGE